MNRESAEDLASEINALERFNFKGRNLPPSALADIIERACGQESAISDYGIPYTVECPECSAEPGSACLMFHGNTGQMRQWPHTLRGELAVRKRACGQDEDARRTIDAAEARIAMLEQQVEKLTSERSCGGTAWVSVADAEAVCDASEVRIRLRDGSELNGAILQSDGDWWWNNRFFDEREVTHWLPSPPTGRTEDK